MKKCITLLTLILMLSLTACDGTSIIDNGASQPGQNPASTESNYVPNQETTNTSTQQPSSVSSFDLSNVPEYQGAAVYVVNNNTPFFTPDELTTESFESYSELDELGRTGVAFACLSTDTMPPEGEERGSIGMIRPAGWHTVKYPDVISDLYLYNRCHLIGWQLCAENANELNLTTGTRYLNVDGMLPYENQVDDYIEQTGNHVMYRVTPVFVDNELVCRGILIEAQSVEDNGCVFCVYCYNVQPYICIDYATGESYQTTDNASNNEVTSEVECTYVLNTNSMKIHRPDCEYAASISTQNRWDYTGFMSDLIDEGYSVCKSCNPE